LVQDGFSGAFFSTREQAANHDGVCAGRLSGMGLPAAFVQAAAVAAIGGFLIGLKALIH
jgi:hypothetical protein